MISTYRKLGLPNIPGVPDFNTTTRDLGQELFHPPNVAGWEGGRSWITPALLLERGNFARAVFFPDMVNFRPPDRWMPVTNQKVAAKIAQGYEITAATIETDDNATSGMEPSGSESMSMFNMMAGADEDYNTRYGSTHGWQEAFRWVKPIPRFAAQLSMTGIVRQAGLATTSEVVDYFLGRLLRVPLAEDDRQALIDFLTRELGTDTIKPAITYLEEPIRHLVHLIMSTPEYQLG